MSVSREVKEGLQIQGMEEQIAYQLTTTPWASTPVITSVKAYEVTNGIRVDVSNIVLTGTASVVGDVITTPIVKSLIFNKIYRIEIIFTSGGLTFVPYFMVKAEY